MTSRRRMLAGGLASLASAALGAAGVRPAAAQRASALIEDLVDSGSGFRAGSGDGIELAPEGGDEVLRATRTGATFTSRPLVASRVFGHVGLHWAANLAAASEVTMELRSRSDEGEWTGWATLSLEGGPEHTPVPDSFAHLRFVGRARVVQYRATFHAGPGGALPVLRRVTATVIGRRRQSRQADSATPALTFRRFLPGLAFDPVPPVVPEPGVVFDRDSGRSLRVIPREDWGADESIRFDEAGDERWPEMFVPVRIVVVHHTASRNDYELDDVAAEIDSIYHYHTLSQGWGDIAYNAIIDRFGNIYEGRHGRGGDPGDAAAREVLSHSVVAGHAHNHEYGSAGVVLLGDSMADDWPMPAPEGPMWDALVRYCSFETGRQILRVTDAVGRPARSDFIRTDGVWDDLVANLVEHRGVEQTFCPGDPVIEMLPDLRAAVTAAIEPPTATGVALTNLQPGGRETTIGNRIAYRWTPPAQPPGWQLAGYEYAVEGWFKPEDREPIAYLSGYTPGPQPRLAWTAVDSRTTEHAFVPASPGQYTFHVRLLMARGGVVRRAAYRASHTFLVGP